ncbi:MAG: ester cyclase, partial [Acidimicrobiia bacterium]
VAWYDPAGSHRMASGNTYTGSDAIGAMVARSLAAYPDLAFTVGSAFTAGADFAIEYTMRGTQQAAIGDRAGTGRTITVDGALVGTRTDTGAVATCVDSLDHHDIRRQLGLTPES